MKLSAIAVALLFTISSCASVGRVQEKSLDDVQVMMASTVQINVHIAMTAIVNGEEIPLDPTGWSGSGVVYAQNGGIISERHSMVLSANHVLDAPHPGDMVPFALGVLRVDAVLITARSADNKTCELKAVALGEDTERDVAVGEAQCELAPAAPIAKHIPPMGAKLYVVGHPLGVPNVMVTEGFFSGWYHKYMIASAPITHGNSGGPVFYDGEIVGLAVRGTDYPNLAIIAPLEQILERVATAAQ